MRNVARIVRPRTFALLFGGYFGTIAFAAWSYASSLSYPWFDPVSSRWVYTAYLVGSAAFVVGIGFLAVFVQTTFDRRAKELGDDLRDLRNSIVPEPLGVEGGSMDVPIDADLEAATLGLVHLQSEIGAFLDSGGATSVVLEAPALTSVTATEQRLLRRRESLKVRQDFLTNFLAGPAVASSVILAVSGALLPGADAFLQTYHQMNTALIVGFAYSWAGIAAYVVASFFAMAGSLRPARKSVGD
ncbi:MAG TPA: hypothetical protein VJ300_00785 [Thermoplasmata archaeon]|nr:hypothetical protein [Thermoplasmata archaeon]